MPVNRTTAKGGLPNVRLDCLHGGTVALAAIRGPAIVNLWASWCPPCRSEMPALARAAQSNPQVAFVGIDSEDERSPAVRFLRLTGVHYPQLLDPDGRVLRAMGLPGLPATFAVDAKGRIVWHRRGGVDAAQLTAGIRAVQRGTA